MVATLLDLARRGFVSIEEKTVVHRGLFGSEKQKLDYIWTRDREAYRAGQGKLAKHERMLIEFMFDKLAGGRDTIGLSEIGKKGSQMRVFYRQWSAAAKAQAAHQQLYDEQSLRGMSLGIITGLIGAICAGGAILLFGPWALILLGAGVLTLLSSLAIPHRTPEAELETRRWKALKNYLQRGHYAPLGSSLSANIDRYLVSAVVLGLSKKHLESLAAQVPSHTLHSSVPWYAMHATTGSSSSPAAFAGAFSAMVATAGSTTSSAAGTGGGATSGGGGGAGGGGGGAG